MVDNKKSIYVDRKNAMGSNCVPEVEGEDQDMLIMIEFSSKNK